MIEAHALHLIRRGRPVLDDVSLTVSRGTFLAVVGPNGAGKSTLLDVLAGTLRPDRGQVWLDGRPLPTWSPRALATARGVVRQSVERVFALTVAEVVMLGRHPHGSRPDDARRVLSCLRRVGAEHLVQRTVDTLSGGERQRVELARVLAQIDRPGLLLLDEPTSAQDLGQQQRILGLARALAHEGHAVVAVLHDLAGAAAFADRLHVLHHGRTVASGPSPDVVRPSLLREVFGLRAEVLRHGGHLIIHPLSTESPC